MSAPEPFYRLMRLPVNSTTRTERSFLEAGLFFSIRTELKELFREAHQEYFSTMNFTYEDENNMLDANFVRFIINDILVSNEYNLAGIARYSGIHTDILNELVTGLNDNPSAHILHRLIEIHHSVRRELYIKIMKRIVAKYMEQISSTEK